MPKSMFEALFFDVFFECVCTPMLGRFFEAPNLENRALASTGTRFSQNRRFQKRFEKTSILALFLEAKPKKIQYKIDSKNVFVFYIDFYAFFDDFASILRSKNHSKIANFRKT